MLQVLKSRNQFVAPQPDSSGDRKAARVAGPGGVVRPVAVRPADPLFRRWCATWNELGGSAPLPSVFKCLLASYNEPHRRYHTLTHLKECFTYLDALKGLASNRAEIEIALWFHDAVYNSLRQDNERKSAEWAFTTVVEAGLPSNVAERVYRYIMATRHDVAGRDADVALLLDVDLSVLGASEERFDEYEAQVREEYFWVPEPMYRNERRKLVERFLNRRHIYHTAIFQQSREPRARRNLIRSLRRLKHGE